MRIIRKLPWYAAALLFWPAISSPAQTLNLLHTFSGNTYTNLDGAGPSVGLVLSGNTVYGAAGDGANGSGTNNFGTVFSVGIDGSNFTVLHSFTNVTSSGAVPSYLLNAEGIGPQGTLILSGDTLFGTAGGGGTNGSGTLFAVGTNGLDFRVLHTFETNVPSGAFPSASTNSEGANPNSLVLAGDVLYGTASVGGTNAFGTIFSINTNGMGFTVLHTFQAVEGKNPESILVVADGTLYGATPIGSTNGAGSIFSISTNGANFRVLHAFAGGATSQGHFLNGLLLSGGTLYGTISIGGTNDTGVIFSLNTNGSAFTILHNFGTNGNLTDGASPEGALMLAGDTLYGTANVSGADGNGTVFSLNTNGSDFSSIYAFTKLHSATNLDGARPQNGVVLGGDSLYGTAYFGGANANGTVFRLAARPTITNLGLAGNNAVIHGINGLAGRSYIVWSSTNASLPLTQWNPVATNALAGGGSFSITATNAADPAAGEQFYILQAQ